MPPGTPLGLHFLAPLDGRPGSLNDSCQGAVMIQRSLAALVIAFIASAGLAVHAQSAATPKGTTGKSAAPIPRTSDGHPDFQGSWTTETYTPFERPAEFKDR